MKQDLHLPKLIVALLIGIFILVMGCLFGDVPEVLRRTKFSVIFGGGLALFVLGIVLIYLTIKRKIRGRLRKFLLLTGVCSTGFLTGVVLHNLVYALFILLFGENFWVSVGMPDEPLFFIFGLVVCPIGFIVGAVGSVVLFKKNKKN